MKQYWLVLILILGVIAWPKITAYIHNSQQSSNRYIFLTKLIDPWYALKVSLTPPNFPRYGINVSPSQLSKINKVLSSIKISEMLTSQEKIEAPATFIASGRTYPIRLSVRGEQGPHWLNAKKSWRIEFTDQDFQGYPELDLIIPSERGYISEQVSNYLAKKLGLPAPDSGYVNITLNGINYGLYFYTQRFNAQYLISHGLPADSLIYGEERSGVTTGPSLFSKEGKWRTYATTYRGPDNFAPIRKLQQLMADPSDTEFFTQLPQILDIDRFLFWQAHSSILGDFHQDNVHNNRLIYPSDTQKLFFVPNDVIISPLPLPPQLINNNQFAFRVLKNSQLAAKHRQIIHKFLSQDDNIQDLLNYTQNLIDQVSVDLFKTPSQFKPISNLMFISYTQSLFRDLQHNLEFLQAN